MLKLRDFKDMGYTVTQTGVTSKSNSDWAQWLCQRRMYGNDGTKYFVNVYVSDPRLWNPPLSSSPVEKSFILKLCFDRGELTFWIDIDSRSWSGIEEIEEVAEEVWSKLNCEYYE